MLNLSRKAFERLVEEAVAGVPKHFRDLVVNVEISVRERPGPEASDLPDADLLLGLYVGPSRAEMESPLAPPEMPARILLYQRNLQETSDDEEGLKREVALTLRHELAHHFGFTDEELEKEWPEGC